LVLVDEIKQQIWNIIRGLKPDMKLCMKLILTNLLWPISLPYFNYAWPSASWILALNFFYLHFLVLFWNFFRLSRVFDCRLEDSYRAWEVNGEVERVLWNHFSPFDFLVSIQLIYHFIIYAMIRVLEMFGIHKTEHF
jgi:hypothetical protein